MAHTKKHHYRRPPVEDQLKATDRIGALLNQADRDGIPEGLEGYFVRDETIKGLIPESDPHLLVTEKK